MDAKTARFNLLLVLFLALPAGCRGTRTPITDVPILRVRLLADASRVMMAAQQPVLVTSSGDRQPRRLSFPETPGVPVVLEANQWRIGSVLLSSGELTLQPEVDGAMTVNGAAYHGSFKLVPTPGGRFDVVNHVDVESYLQGVLARELFKDWDEEAFKAQAIVARTYALYEARTQGIGRHWDVWADVRSQAYGGIAAETGKANQAVEDSRGVVVAFGPPGQEKIFKAYFSACCGGAGQNPTDAFGEAFIPPLAEKHPRDLCSISTKYNWPAVAIPKAELTRRIKSWGASRNHPVQRLGNLDRIDIEYVNTFGRPVRFLLTDTSGQRFTLGSEETRWAINADRGGGPQLLSSYFKPVNRSSDIVFSEGHGHGHGVGMCQWCAQSMALQGIRAEQIVRYSYPQSVLIRAY